MILIEIFGWIGSALLILAYALLTLEKVKARSWQYQTMNAVGALALVVNSIAHGALPPAALNTVWFVIGGVGLITILRAGGKSSSVKD